ncbi:hypothetical protein [Mycobacteroides abscessus]|uniref:hypothetical protein n=1 Tax=Mycobacteroides abscessus TaxID=36809 RepID=UPI00092BBFED|nr:hypothetical protein [Mycobacteroides abscessus]MBN7457880.1 hypothetical protein [Mycobacteroides abscessus subsp. abscessus]SIE11882.1 Uncharacterised protein [Mycobacteroides abscessus subsp. abscessus]SKU94599.1 Uncharacterised protein [Mycobacteroides abscessus subsp. bolletii]SLC71839.1 Uncharacterised protein [Mycobacteroides abscessus subsp. massiliense]SLJ49493.1 Uncharacterised protein [Mycobacteroides abscessus subsp. abscessus]
MDDLDRALARVANAKLAFEQAVDDLHSVIRHQVANGPRGTQAQIARRTGFSREHIRQIAQLQDTQE